MAYPSSLVGSKSRPVRRLIRRECTRDGYAQQAYYCMSKSNGIGTLREQSLHAGLKAYLAQPGDTVEKLVDGYHIDIQRGDLLIEIQTKNFSMIKRKLAALLEGHKVLLVHPVAQAKWIVRRNRRGKQVARRKSPAQGRAENVFRELIRMPALATHPNLSLELLFTHEEEIWRDDGQGSWRRGKWSIEDRRLLQVVGAQRIEGREGFLGLLPKRLPEPFTNKQLAKALKIRPDLATKMTYCLRKMGALEVVGKDGRSYLFGRLA